jgi:PAS domain S-box-containing protein
MIDNGDSLVLLTDPDGIVNFVSDHCVRVIGNDPSYFMGKQFPDIIHPEDAAPCLAAWQALAHDGTEFRVFQNRIIDASGMERWVNHMASLVRVNGNTPAELMDIPVIEAMVHPDDQGQVLAALQKIIMRGRGGITAIGTRLAVGCTWKPMR